MFIQIFTISVIGVPGFLQVPFPFYQKNFPSFRGLLATNYFGFSPLTMYILPPFLKDTFYWIQKCISWWFKGGKNPSKVLTLLSDRYWPNHNTWEMEYSDSSLGYIMTIWHLPSLIQPFVMSNSLTSKVCEPVDFQVLNLLWFGFRSFAAKCPV